MTYNLFLALFICTYCTYVQFYPAIRN